MNWCFAKINGRLAEVYFDTEENKSEIKGHCYVSLDEYTTRQELKLVKKDTELYQFSYRNKIYRQKN